MKKAFLLFLSFFLFSCGNNDRGCENLISISEDKAIFNSVVNWLAFIKKNPQTGNLFGTRQGLVFVRDLNVDLKFDFGALGIPREFLTFELLGENVEYTNISSSEIKAISFGYGYRESIVFFFSEDFRETNYSLSEKKIKHSNKNSIVICEP